MLKMSTLSSVAILSSCLLLCNGQSWSTGEGNPNNPYGDFRHQSRLPIDSNHPDSYQLNIPSYYGGTGNSLAPFLVLYEWSKLDYTWLEESTKTHSLTNRKFIPENNALAGIKIWRERIFVTIPRMKNGVPVTIASLPIYPHTGQSPLLDPFPNWQMQEIGNCTAFQSVQSMEIDTEGRIWVLDIGRTNTLDTGSHQSRCAPKLVIIDLNSVVYPPRYPTSGTQFRGQNSGFQTFPNQQYPNQNQQYPNQNQQYPGQYFGQNQQFPGYNQQYPHQGQNQQYPNQGFQNQQFPNQYNPNTQNINQQQYPNQNQFNPQFGSGYQNQFQQFGSSQFRPNFQIVRTFTFPTSVATSYGNYLNDIVLDNSDGWYAYITDNGDDPGIIVYSFVEDRAWKVKDARSMRSSPEMSFLSINNIDVELRDKNIHGIALSPVTSNIERTVYFSPLGSFNIYSIPTTSLKNHYLPSDVSSYVTDHGRKESISDGMIMDNRGNLYFGLLTMNAIGVWNTRHGRLGDVQRIMAKDNRALQWADSFAIDETGHLYVVTSRLHNFLTGRVISDEPNYRILKAPIGSRSYLQYEDMTSGVARFGDSNYYDLHNYYLNCAFAFRTAEYLVLGVVLFFAGR